MYLTINQRIWTLSLLESGTYCQRCEYWISVGRCAYQCRLVPGALCVGCARELAKDVGRALSA